MTNNSISKQGQRNQTMVEDEINAERKILARLCRILNFLLGVNICSYRKWIEEFYAMDYCSHNLSLIKLILMIIFKIAEKE